MCIGYSSRGAAESFRCISWDDLPREVLAGGGLKDFGGHFPSYYYGLSRPAKLGDCDVFLSHSWHDDSEAKWEALSTWCESFRSRHGRAPTLWVDKVCIDQTRIAEDLAHLPEFLAGCRNLLVLCGDTYTSRVWCSFELSIFLAAGRREDVHIVPLGAEMEKKVRMAWDSFDVAQCESHRPEDKAEVLRHIQRSRPCGGLGVFNDEVRSLANRIVAVA